MKVIWQFRMRSSLLINVTSVSSSVNIILRVILMCPTMAAIKEYVNEYRTFQSK
jgi:hypothetical protein